MTKVLIINNEKNINNLGLAPKIAATLTQQDKDKIEIEILHYTEISKKRIQTINPHMIFLTGRLTYAGDVEKDDYTAELKMIREADVPLFGICLGHQLISIAYGAKLGKIFETADDEADIREQGFVEINKRLDDPIFNGINHPFLAYEYHLEEVKVIPKNFEVLASSELCNVQAIRHKEKLIYGLQFHPEAYHDIFPEGERILQNFFELVRPRTIYHIPGIQLSSAGYDETETIAME